MFLLLLLLGEGGGGINEAKAKISKKKKKNIGMKGVWLDNSTFTNQSSVPAIASIWWCHLDGDAIAYVCVDRQMDLVINIRLNCNLQLETLQVMWFFLYKK